MKRRLGGLLSLALGIVLIAGGSLSGTGSGAVGVAQQCSPTATVGVVDPCPTGTITITQHTAAAATFATPAQQKAAAAPANFTVKITSTCNDPGSAPAAAVNQTVTVPTGGSASSGDLYVYTAPSDTTKCSYALTQTPVVGYTATFTPSSPVTLPDPPVRGDDDLAVTLTDTAAAATSTSSAPSSSAPSSSSSAAPSSASDSASASASATVISVGSSSAAPLANTGPRSSITFSLVAGIALCLLGLVLLFAGRLSGGAARRRR